MARKSGLRSKKSAPAIAKRTRRKKNELPKLREHASGQAYAYFGRYVYFGLWEETEIVQRNYQAACRIYRDNGNHLPENWWDEAQLLIAGSDISQLVADYLTEMETQLATFGDRGRQIQDLRRAGKAIHDTLGTVEAADLKRAHIVQLQKFFIHKRGVNDKGRPTAGYVSRQMTAARRFFRWGVDQETYDLPERTLDFFDSVKRPKAGEMGLRHSAPKQPADLSLVRDVIYSPTTSEILRDMITFQSIVGLRPEEICRLCEADFKQVGGEGQRNTDVFKELSGVASGSKTKTAKSWVVAPEVHKNDKRGKDRAAIVPDAGMRIARKYFGKGKKTEPMFSPRIHYKQQQKLHVAYYGHKIGGKPTKSTAFTYDTYLKAVKRACSYVFPYPEDLAKLTGESDSAWRKRTGQRRLDFDKEFSFTPIQLRKAALTEWLKIGGREIAAAQGGHDERTSPRYAKVAIEEMQTKYNQFLKG